MRIISHITQARRGSAIAALAIATAAAATSAAAASSAVPGSGHLSIVGAPTVLLTNEQRLQLGIKFGLDTPIDFFRKKDGQYYINSAGGLGPANSPAHQAAFDLHVDSQLTHILALSGSGGASGPQDVLSILTDHAADCGARAHRLRATDAGGSACGQYFDRDYAGGGTYFRCPDNATSVYFYHGENHTSPDGIGGHGGWFGIGVGYYNGAETTVTPARQLRLPGGGSTAQIIGLNLSTVWNANQGADAPPQANPYNGVPSAIPRPDGFLYVYHGNATNDPEYNPSACRPECMSVSRAPIAAFCSAIKTASPVPWTNYYHGAWSQPAVETAASPLGFGAGGSFTPSNTKLLPGEHGGTVTYLPARNLFVMAQLLRGGIDVHYSSDGLTWSPAKQLIEAPEGSTPNGDGQQIIYPKIVVTQASGHENYVLIYVLVAKGHFWRWAALMRQALAYSPG